MRIPTSRNKVEDGRLHIHVDVSADPKPEVVSRNSFAGCVEDDQLVGA